MNQSRIVREYLGLLIGRVVKIIELNNDTYFIHHGRSDRYEKIPREVARKAADDLDNYKETRNSPYT